MTDGFARPEDWLFDDEFQSVKSIPLLQVPRLLGAELFGRAQNEKWPVVGVEECRCQHVWLGVEGCEGIFCCASILRFHDDRTTGRYTDSERPGVADEGLANRVHLEHEQTQTRDDQGGAARHKGDAAKAFDDGFLVGHVVILGRAKYRR